MRKNTVLAAAITTALSINVVYAGSFANWPTCTHDSSASINPCASVGANTVFFDDDNDTAAGSPDVAVNFGNDVVKSPGNGINFSTHLFGGSGVILPSTDYFAAKYQLEGEVDFAFEFRVTLSNGAQFDTTILPTLEFKSRTRLVSGVYTTADTTIDTLNTPICDTSTCKWNINPTSDKLKDGDMFFVFYKIKNAQVLANAGEKITLTAQLGTTFTPALIDTREIPIALAADPVEVTFEPGTDTGIRISVAAQNTEFSSKTASSNENASPQQATIGYLQVKQQGDPTNPIMGSDGSTRWDLGNTDASAGGSAIFDVAFDSTNKVDTSLTITGGQFAASVTGSTGKVFLDTASVNTCATISSDQIEADEVDENNATWQLSNSDLQDIVKVSGCSNTNKIPIVIKANGTTSINIVENAPTAALTLDYLETDNLHDIQYGPTELSKFKADGTVCWVYNVPGSAAADTLALRITNDTSSAGTVNGTLYDQEGVQIFPAEGSPPLNLLGEGVELQPGETKPIFSTTLEALGGDTPFSWKQRGALQITSTLSRLEVLTLLRSATGTLTNLSTGTHGAACQN